MAENAKDSTELEFKILSEADLPEVMALEKLCFSTPWTEQQYQALLRAGACKLFGVSGRGRLLAYVSVAMVPATGELEIYNIAVAPDKRREGIGKQLLEALLGAAGALGVRRAVLEVRESNEPAIALYRSMGFRECGKRRDYYSAPTEDALIFDFDATPPDLWPDANPDAGPDRGQNNDVTGA